MPIAYTAPGLYIHTKNISSHPTVHIKQMLYFLYGKCPLSTNTVLCIKKNVCSLETTEIVDSHQTVLRQKKPPFSILKNGSLYMKTQL